LGPGGRKATPAASRRPSKGARSCGQKSTRLFARKKKRPDRSVTFRNLGWSADTPAAVPATTVESAAPTPLLFKIVRNPHHRPFAPNRDLNRQAMSAPFRT
jgi:hypothetical protein